MRFEQQIVPQVDRLFAAFEHSITWEDDLWRADPVDVEAIHAPARRKFGDLLDAVTTERGSAGQARILLFHGQSGAGKTHLIRALRTAAHRPARAAVSLRPPADRPLGRGGGRARPQHGGGARLRDHRIARAPDVGGRPGGAGLLYRPGRGFALLRRLPGALPEGGARPDP